MKILSLAWRNVWRHQRRTLVTMGAMALAVFALINYAALVDGYLYNMRRNILDLEVGDLQVFSAQYQEDPGLHSVIDEPQNLVKQLEERGYRASARTLAAGLAAAGKHSTGVSFRGVHVDSDATITDVHKHVAAGRWLEETAPHEVVIGTKVARVLGVGVGDELVVLGQGADGSMANDLYVVRGVLRSIADGVDRSGVYMTDGAFRELMVLPQGSHQIIVRAPEGKPLDAAKAELSELAPTLDVQTWRELMPEVASLLETTDGAMVVMFLIVNTAIGIVILNAMLMAVFERIREFGVLKALGVGPTSVLLLIFVEATIMTVVAAVVGVALSIPMLWYLATVGLNLRNMAGVSIMGVAWNPIWRAQVSVESFSGPLFTLFVIVYAATAYPALRAAFIQPVEAMRHR